MALDTSQAARYYTDKLCWYLITMPAGSKGPTGLGWNEPSRAISDPDKAQEYYDAHPTHNMGVLLGASGIVTLDVDHVENTRTIFAALGIDYDAIMSSAPRIIGRPDRGKVVFRAPSGTDLKTHKISWPSKDDPRKTEVVFELRAGAVQDVIPPSIHPTTQQPYQWAGDPSNLPEIPHQLLEIWTHWDRFRPQLQSICPWRVTIDRPPSPKRVMSSDSTSVIDAYNAATDIHEILERHGYKRTAPNRYLSPNSTSGLAGVNVFDDGRAFSHHASDPFDSEHTFDAFDVFCYYEHMGDTSKAVKSAAELLQITNDPEYEYDAEAIEHGAKVAAQIMRPKAAAKADGIPEHLTTIPGTLQDAVNYYNTTATRDQPQYAVQTALAIAATAMGRRWVTDYRNYPSLFLLNIGETGCGKEHGKFVIETILDASGHGTLIGPSGYTSASGVFSALIGQPCHVTVIDEFGRQLKSAAARGNQHKADSLTSLMEVFGRLGGTLRPTGFSKMGMTQSQQAEFEKVVRNPALTVYGMSTPEEFYAAISGADVSSGLLNRFIIVRSDIGVQKARRTRHIDVTDRLIDWIDRHATANGSSGNLSGTCSHDMPPEAILVKFSDAALEILDKYEDKIIADMRAARSDALKSMLNRNREIAMRVSLIVARSLEQSEISAQAMQWAVDYVSFYSDQAVQMFRENMSDGPFEAACKAVLVKINQAGLKGVTSRELSRSVRSFANLNKRQRGEVFEVLQEDHGIVATQRQTGGRPAIAWVGEVE